MTKMPTKLAAVLVIATIGLQACSTEQVVNGTVDTTGFVAKTAVKGTIGAGKLAVKGVKKVAGSDG